MMIVCLLGTCLLIRFIEVAILDALTFSIVTQLMHAVFFLVRMFASFVLVSHKSALVRCKLADVVFCSVI